MKTRIIHGVAGTFILTSLTLAMLVDIHWLWMTVFVGLNLLQSSLTRFCPLEKILDYAGIGREEHAGNATFTCGENKSER